MGWLSSHYISQAFADRKAGHLPGASLTQAATRLVKTIKLARCSCELWSAQPVLDDRPAEGKARKNRYHVLFNEYFCQVPISMSPYDVNIFVEKGMGVPLPEATEPALEKEVDFSVLYLAKSAWQCL